MSADEGAQKLSEMQHGEIIEKNVLASDGYNYRITAAFDAASGIPEDAELLVTEILPDTEENSPYKEEDIANGDPSYEEYVACAEQALGMDRGTAGYIRLFDIAIVDKTDGTYCQPAEGTGVDIKIELTDAGAQDLNVVHFAHEEAGDTAPAEQGASENGEGTDISNRTTEDTLNNIEIIESTAETSGSGQVVCFSANGFSVYGVISRESSADNTALDGKTYVLVTQNNALLTDTVHSDPQKLTAMNSNPTVGGILQVNGVITAWTFEAVEDRPGWYYISNGNGGYINIMPAASGDGGAVTLGDRQPIYVAARADGQDTVYQLRTDSVQNGSFAVNNYGNAWANGFGAWKSGSGKNEWFRFYEMEFLGDYKVTFNANEGTGDVPPVMWGTAGNAITLPEYNGSREGYTFLGWSTGKNLANNVYYPVYPAGSAYIIPENNITLYAVWTSNTAAKGEFYIRLDGTIPYEPGQYENSAYTGMIGITGAIRYQAWVTDNDVHKPSNGLYIENNVTALLNQVPDTDQIVNNINSSRNKLGFRVTNDDGRIVVSEIINQGVNESNYNVSKGDGLHVLWYVQKHTSSAWHVDGTLLIKDKVNISYDGNVPDGTVKNVPLGYQEAEGTDVTIGASGSRNGAEKTPTRPGYIFLGWNLKQDGTGEVFNNGDIFTLNEDTVLYAQWSKGTNMMTVSKTNEDGDTLAGARFILEERTASGGYIEKANRTTGTGGAFVYDRMENDTLYRMTETYAPNGYEVRNSFFFKVAVAEDGSEILQLRVCDENGDFLPEEEIPDWLGIEYIPAEDPRAQGVARIRFNIRDERIERSITFIKTDETGSPLPGAQYTISNAKGEVGGVLKERSDDNGVFSEEYAVLPYGTYTLTETDAPSTFAAHEPVIFTLNDYADETNNGLTIDEDRSGCVTEVSCDVTSVVEQGLTTTTYAYTVKVKDVKQAHIIVTKAIAVDGDLNPGSLNTTIYYALTRKGEEGYVRNADGEIWIETMEIVNGVPYPSEVIFDGVDFGQYDVWEMALIDGEYTKMYNGLVVSDEYQLDSVSASSADGGNNANVSEEDFEGKVEFTNHYGPITESTRFVANKRWTDRAGNEIDAPDDAAIEFTLYSVDSGGTERSVRSIELDGEADPDGETDPWQATFKYLPIADQNGGEYKYKVKETSTVPGYYPNDYPNEYYITSSGGTITNRKLTTDIELHKYFDIYPENEALPRSADGPVFTLNGPDGERIFTLSDFSVSPNDPYDHILTLTGLPLGEYTFSETGQENALLGEGYELVCSVSSAAGKAEAGGLQQPVLELELKNTYAKRSSFVLKKNPILYEAEDGSTLPEAFKDKRFDFTVKRGDLYLQENGSLLDVPYLFSLKEGESRRFTDIPSGRYTVVEQNASVEGYEWEVVGGIRSHDGTYSKQIVLEDTKDDNILSFDNRYTKTEYGSLTIRKEVVGGPQEAETRNYKVEITTEKHDETMWVTEEGSLTTERTELLVTPGKPLSFASLPVGTYTISEDEDDAAYEAYSLDVTYSTDKNIIAVHKNGSADLTLTNTYNSLYAPVKITKTVSGNMGDKELHFGFDVYITNAGDDQAIVIDGVTDEQGRIRFSLKDGEEKLLEKLPKGAKITIVEHNEHYDTTVVGRIGLEDSLTEEEIQAETTLSDLAADTTKTYAFVIPDEGATVDFLNEHTEQTVILKKVGSDEKTGETRDLQGAVFRIYKDKEKQFPVAVNGQTEFVSEEDGVLYKGRFRAGTYYLDEVHAPDGYMLPSGMYKLTVTEEGVALAGPGTEEGSDLNTYVTSGTDGDTGDIVYLVEIQNEIHHGHPSMGGSGIRHIQCLGAILLFLTGAGFFVRRKYCRSH